MPIEFQFYDIPRERWAAAWALHAHVGPDGTLHLNIWEFAESVGVPTDAATLDVLAAMVHRYVELLVGAAVPREDTCVPFMPTRH